MRKSLLILCWLIAAPGALLALLIILPAPSYYLWKVAVGVSEWSVWLLLAGLTSLSCGACTLRSGRRSASAWIGITLSLVTVVCAGVPVVGAYRVAAQRGVSLSWRRYFLGAGGGAAPPPVDLKRAGEV